MKCIQALYACVTLPLALFSVLASIQTIESVKADGGTRATGLQKFLEESGTLVRGDTGAMLKPSSQLQRSVI